MFPSRSRKRAKTLPHTGVSSPSSRRDEEAGACAGSYLIRRSRGDLVKRTPFRDHSWNRPVTSEVMRTTCVARPISLCSTDPFGGATRLRTAVPSGGETPTQRSPDCRRVSITSRNPSRST